MRLPDPRSTCPRPPTARSRTSVSRRRIRAAALAPPQSAGPATGTGLTVDVCADEQPPRVVVTGELDVATAGMLTAVLEHVQRSHPEPVRVDLGGVTFADTSGLEPVLAPGSAVLTATSPAVRLVIAALAATALAGSRP